MVTAIILSGGSGKRMGVDCPKQYLNINGKMALEYTLISFQESMVDEIVLVCAEGYEDLCRELLCKNRISKCKKVVIGGAERYFSVYEGLKACSESDYVLIHDGARVCIESDTINMAIDKVKKLKACVVGIKAIETIHMTDNDGKIVSSPDRRLLWTAQTPQCFSYSLCFDAYKKAIEAGDRGITDDAMVVRKYGGSPVYMIDGKATNIKLTRPSDIPIIESILSESKK